MHTEIKYLFSEQSASVKRLALNIAEQIKVEAIVLYGIRLHNSLSWLPSNIIAPEPESASLSVDLLIITSKAEKRAARDIINLVEKMQTPELNITCIAHTKPFISKALAATSLFFSRIQDKGILLWGSWPSTSTSTPNIETYIKHADAHFRNTISQMWKIYEAAEGKRYQTLPTDTLPKIRQAAKTCAKSLLWILTGHRPANRTLQSLLLLMQTVGFDYKICFDPKTKNAEELFSLLYETATIPHTWKDDRVRTEELLKILELVSDLISWAYEYAEDKIQEWQAKAKSATLKQNFPAISTIYPTLVPLTPAS